MFTFRISELVFSGGEQIALEENALVILIGPNNCGKSQTLREITEHIHGQPFRLVLNAIHHDSSGSIADLRQWLDTNYPSIRRDGRKIYSTSGNSVDDSTFTNGSAQPDKVLSRVVSFLIHYLNTSTRLTQLNATSNIDLYEESPEHYFHFLLLDDALLEVVSKKVREAFGVDVIPSWGKNLYLRVGDEPRRSRKHDRVSERYQQALRELPRLAHEGDGIKSFVCCILAVKCGAHKVLLIDEPEAFLHPPQARRLGRILAESAKELKRQVIIATHSSDVVRGAISSSSKVAVCRIHRDGDQNHAHLLNSAELQDLWNKPLLRSSGAVEGIFHKGVVVCESDSDTRFYESLLLRSERIDTFVQPVDFHFIHGGGKGELATLARSYNQLKVPVVAIADFDILKNKDELKILVNAMGGDFTRVEGLYNSVSSALAELPPSSSKGTAINEVRRLLDVFESDNKKKTLTGGDKEKISDLLNDARDWSEPKKYGIQKLRGGTHRDCQRLLSQLKQLGIFVVPQGELESWNRSGSATKNIWIREALELMNGDPASFAEASAFLDEITAFLGISLRNEAVPKP